MKIPTFATALLIMSATHAWADPQADIDYIVSQTITEDIMAAGIEAQRPVLVPALESNFRQNGIEVSDLDKFVDVLLSEWLTSFTEEFRSEIGDVYRAEFSDAQLSDLAAFYRSDAGQALLAKTPAIAQASAQLGMQLGPVALGKVKNRMDARLKEEGVTLSKPNALERIFDAL